MEILKCMKTYLHSNNATNATPHKSGIHSTELWKFKDICLLFTPPNDLKINSFSLRHNTYPFKTAELHDTSDLHDNSPPFYALKQSSILELATCKQIKITYKTTNREKQTVPKTQHLPQNFPAQHVCFGSACAKVCPWQVRSLSSHTA